MSKSVFFILIVLLITSCSSDQQVGIFDSFPVTYVPDRAEILGSATYFYTDTIIFKTDNLLTENLDIERARFVDSIFFEGDTSRLNFPIKTIEFTDASGVIVTTNQPNQANFTERSGIGTIMTPEPIAFKVNADQETLITCITITNKRRIDTIQQEDFIAGLDTFVNVETDVPFQLSVVDTDTIEIGFCNPFGELDQVTEFSNRNGLRNDERIITHRTDLIFKRSTN